MIGKSLGRYVETGKDMVEGIDFGFIMGEEIGKRGILENEIVNDREFETYKIKIENNEYFN